MRDLAWVMVVRWLQKLDLVISGCFHGELVDLEKWTEE